MRISYCDMTVDVTGVECQIKWFLWPKRTAESDAEERLCIVMSYTILIMIYLLLHYTRNVFSNTEQATIFYRVSSNILDSVGYQACHNY